MYTRPNTQKLIKICQKLKEPISNHFLFPPFITKFHLLLSEKRYQEKY